ncbi:hypothetical protein LPJ62_005074, partial [Coemansia sp. RSA 2167]
IRGICLKSLIARVWEVREAAASTRCRTALDGRTACCCGCSTSLDMYSAPQCVRLH